MRVAPPEFFHARITRLRALLSANGIDALVVTSLPNVAYLTGFFASAAAALVTGDTLHAISDGRYATILGERRAAFPFLQTTIVEGNSSYDETMVGIMTPFAGLRVGVEASHVTLQRYRSLLARLEALGGWSNGLVETDGLIETLRLQKDEWEVGRLRDGAVRLSDAAKCILQKALAGRTEGDVAAEIEAELRRVGFAKPAFDTIVAAGPNAALPHARASERLIQAGELVVLDFGGMLDGYCTDLTRTVIAGSSGTTGTSGTAGAAGPAGSKEREVIRRVVEAQQAAFDVLKPGVQPEVADAAARETLAKYGLAEQFTHGTGHGLGLEIHEGPRATRARPERAEPPLAPGMVMTLEPGVYFPGWGGVRIEDDVLVTEDGAQWLTDVPRIV